MGYYPLFMKSLVACKHCSRQYDVSGYRPGQKLRCVCGQVIEVPEERGVEASVLHCAACGAPVARDAKLCEYCGSPLDHAAASQTMVCPGCFSRIPEGASFCTHCGLAIEPQKISPEDLSDLSCPRCEGQKLVPRDVDGRHFFECPSCCGLFLEKEEFSAIVREMSQRFEESPVVDQARKGRPLEKVVYLKCPVCGQFMARKNYAKRSGVIVDECPDHGLWLDDGELAAIAEFVARGGLVEAHKVEAAEARRMAEQRKSVQRLSVPTGALAVRSESTSFLGWVVRVLLG